MEKAKRFEENKSTKLTGNPIYNKHGNWSMERSARDLHSESTDTE